MRRAPLLRNLQQGNVPLEADQQINRPRVRQRLGVEQHQCGDVFGTGQPAGELGGYRVGRFEHVHLGERRRLVDHVYGSINSYEWRLPLFHKGISANREPAASAEN